MNKLLEAAEFAAVKHRFQKRKDSNNTPYINHPLNVANLLARADVTDVDVLIAGLLHDTIEDTGTTVTEIKEKFGEKVANIVVECSDDKSLPKEKRKQLQIEHASTASLGAQLVKLADKYSNLSDLLRNPPKTWSKGEIYGYAHWCYAVYKKLKGVNKKFDELFAELFNEFKIANLNDEQLAILLNEYYANIKNSD